MSEEIPQETIRQKLEESDYHKDAEQANKYNLSEFFKETSLSKYIKKMKETGEIIPGAINILIAGSATSNNVLAVAKLIKDSGIDDPGNKVVIADFCMTPLKNQERMIASNDFTNSGVETKFFTTAMDIRALAIKDNSIDIMISDMTFTFCENEQCIKNSLEEVQRVLKEKGAVFISLITNNQGVDLYHDKDGGIIPSLDRFKQYVREANLNIEIKSESDEDVRKEYRTSDFKTVKYVVGVITK